MRLWGTGGIEPPTVQTAIAPDEGEYRRGGSSSIKPRHLLTGTIKVSAAVPGAAY
jgi:hypothetical protein